MSTLHISLKKTIDSSYDILIGQDLLPQIIKDLKEKSWGSKYAIITDSAVQSLFGMELKKTLRKNDIKCDLFSFHKGEKSKNLATIRKLATKLIHKNYNRSDAIIALGGGVVGDVAAFLASVFMRGIPFIQIPTSILAMVDSSIGGKTGVDLDVGKNLIGSFYQPKKVYMDTNILEKLPKRQISNGLAEVIKYGCIYDENFFEYLEGNVQKCFEHNHKVLEYIIKKSCEIKGAIVEKDEKELQDLRMILNYGHTVGHALEILSKFNIQHGEAIAMGMIEVNKRALKKSLMDKIDADRIKKLFNKAFLPTEIPARFTTEKIQKIMLKDKKVKNNQIRFVICPKIGQTKIIENL
ncbi:3-dehydroquinate synthase [Candidatus Peregrinibacteria bacterium RIFOXYB2_FULL_32_7]|nr:MAG: 3-dehydroquinate synthase [Candidatus Peregrinibacteria bacterium RIFOXYB2_FULL_32_7]